ncbi:MAG: hypothetical protein BWK79_15470 [Beggiatoa sp. IS2]|nr:MAG: hypothetical protein BWK79_15470 [Beggiatoa sp. IS2]
MLQFKFFHYMILIVLLGFYQKGYAHTIKIFAMAEGDKINGYVYFPGGGRVQQAQINIQSLAQASFDKITTDLQGEFSYQVRYRTDYLLAVKTDDGHRAEYTIKAEELSENLPTVQNGKLEKSNELYPVKSMESVNLATLSTTELTNLIEKTVSQQLRPLREQLEQYEAKVRLHDILGGVGYIFGVMGLLFYFGMKKRS